MKTKFQPKIIIGSLVGIFSSIVGFIAIFFPSLFNLETQKIEEFSCVIQTYEDCEKLDKFLHKYIFEKSGIFKLNIDFSKSKEFEKKLNESHNPAIKKPCLAQYTFSYNIDEGTKKFVLHDEDEVLLKSGEDIPTLYGNEYTFLGLILKKNMPDNVISKIEGYFTWEFQEASYGITYVKFKKVPEEEILIKNY